MADKRYCNKDDITAPYGDAEEVLFGSPAADVILDGISRGVMVNVAGTLDLYFEDDHSTKRTITVLAKTIYPFAVYKVGKDSTATGIMAFR